MPRRPLTALAFALALAACGPASTSSPDVDSGGDPGDEAAAPTPSADATPSPDPAAGTPSPTSVVVEVVVGGEGDTTVVSDPFTTDGTLVGFVVEGSTTGDRADVVLWLAEAATPDSRAAELPDGCVGVEGSPPDLTIEDAAGDASDGCVLLQVLSFEPGAGLAGGLGEPIPAGTWQIWAEPYGPVPTWRVTYRSCEDSVAAAPSLFETDELTGEFCSGD